jgi:hypothetical protein
MRRLARELGRESLLVIETAQVEDERAVGDPANNGDAKIAETFRKTLEARSGAAFAAGGADRKAGAWQAFGRQGAATDLACQ